MVEMVASPKRKSMSMWSVSALGIGSMVGAGIFALLGQAVLMTGSDVYISFAIGGVAALLSGYSYSRLAARFPSSGGIMDYFDRAFPSKVLAGGLSLLYLVTLVVSIAMIAKTFGAYADRMLLGDASPPFVANIFASAIVIILVVVNMIGSGAVGRIEELLVATKLIILAGLLVAGASGIDLSLLRNGPTVGPTALFASVGLTFFAYAGYGIMTNAAGHVANPATTIPRAIFLAIGVVIVLYVGLSVVVQGNLTPEEVAQFSSTAVAQAAKPVLGNQGFVIVSIGALFATSSAINANLFSALEISRGLADKGQLPAMFGRVAWGRGTRGMVWSAGAILVMVNVFDLGDIAQVAGATFLITYLAVFTAHWRLHGEVGGARVLIVAGAVLMTTVLAAFLIGLWPLQVSILWLTALAVVGSLGVAWLIQRYGAAR